MSTVTPALSLGYFAHPYVSNSDLSAFEAALSAQDATDYADALRFGTLLHAVVLEPHTVDLITLRIEGQPYQYTSVEVAHARKMRLSFLNDPFARQLLVASATEVEMYHEATAFSHNGVGFTLNTRRKYDGWLHAPGWGWDLKSTTATSQHAFEAAISRFSYDRARVFYAKGPGAMQDAIIGVSKVAPYKVFKVTMKAGDKLWQSGERKMNELAYKFWALHGVQKEVAA